MPVIKSAKKKLRVDRKREKANRKLKKMLDLALKKAEKSVSMEAINSAISIVDKSAKKNIIHKNKAARIKSRLSKLLAKTKITPTKKAKAKTKKITPKTL